MRYRRFNRVDKPKTLQEMKAEATARYRQFADKERVEMRKAGFKGAAAHEGPIQTLGAEG